MIRGAAAGPAAHGAPAAGRRGVLGALARPALLVTPWGQLTAGGGLCVLLVLATCGSPYLEPATVVTHLRIAMVLLAVGVAGALDDPTRPHLDGTPVPLTVREGPRLLIALAVTAGWWALALLAAARHPRLAEARDVPATPLTTEAAALVVVTLAVAAMVMRRRRTPAALAAAGSALGLPTAVVLLGLWEPLRDVLYARYPGPLPDGAAGADAARWHAAHQRWLALAFTACAALLWALRDPAGPRRRHAAGPAPGPGGAARPTIPTTDGGTPR